MKRRHLYEDGTVGDPVECADWSEAYDVCRERDVPTVCLVGGDRLGRCFPSGYFEALNEAAREEEARERGWRKLQREADLHFKGHSRYPADGSRPSEDSR